MEHEKKITSPTGNFLFFQYIISLNLVYSLFFNSPNTLPPPPPPSFAQTIVKYFWEYADLPIAFHINSLCKTTTMKHLLIKYIQKNWNNSWNNKQTSGSSVKSNFLITTFILYFFFLPQFTLFVPQILH